MGRFINRPQNVPKGFNDYFKHHVFLNEAKTVLNEINLIALKNQLTRSQGEFH